VSKQDRVDTEIEIALRRFEPAIGDDGFSETVMARLPQSHFSAAAKRRWTLGGAAALGGILTSVLGAPLETAFSTFVLQGGYGMAVLGVACVVGLVAIPVAWALYSR